MQTTKKVVIQRNKSSQNKAEDFNFSPVIDQSFTGNFRKNAWETYKELPFPDQKAEAWRRTSLSEFDPGLFRPASSLNGNTPEIPQEYLKTHYHADSSGYLLVSPKQVFTYLDPSLKESGVIFSDFQTAEKENPDLLKKLRGKIVRANEGKFAALASAMSENGIILYVPKNLQIKKPLQSLFWSPGNQSASFLHLLVLIDEGASVKYIHELASPEQKESSLFAGITEIQVNPAAKLEFNEIQTLGSKFWNFSHERARIERDASLDWVYLATGSWRSKNFLDLDLAGIGAEARMSGFYFTNQDQHIDLDTQQNHLKPHTTSDLLFKGAAQDKSRAVWQGMIYVAPGADKTDGYQTNRNMLLSSNARIDTIPGLEIKADDVRCSHGATIGKIEESQIFYLLARGIPYEDAVRLIVEGFFNPIIDRIQNPDIQTKIHNLINEKI